MGKRHWVQWADPFQTLLFGALVAADLGCLKDTFQAQDGRVIDPEIYADTKDIPDCDFAMEALKKSMTWDEKSTAEFVI